MPADAVVMTPTNLRRVAANSGETPKMLNYPGQDLHRDLETKVPVGDRESHSAPRKIGSGDAHATQLVASL